MQALDLHSTRPQRCCFWQPGALLALLLTLATPAALALEPINEAHFKAAYLLKLSQFVQIPGEVAASHIHPRRVCVAGAPELLLELRSLSVQLPESQRPSVAEINLPAALTDRCDLVFISGLNRGERRRYLASLQGLPLLTIGDQSGFAQDGGMIELTLQNQRMGFEVNLRSTRFAGITIESNLLRLASTVYTQRMEARAE